MNPSKFKVHIETIGCKLNQFESQAIAESLKDSGFEVSPEFNDADCVIINTCSVTNKADAKSRLVMHRAKKAGKRVVATGCYATTDFEQLKESEFADIIVKNDSKFKIPELLNTRFELESSIPGIFTHNEFPIVHQFDQTRAFIKIQDGCDKFCSYCKIPHARGRSRSLDQKSAIEFIRQLLQRGYKEIVLTGINISDYNCGSSRLYDIVAESLQLEGDFRVRLSSLQPDEFDPRFIQLLGHPKFAGHFHLSLQSGSTGVLKRMDRNYTAGIFLKQTQAIRQADPAAGITTDIIVGFPGETEQEFQETLDLVKEAAFTRVHIFPYSPRAHTKASRLPDIDPHLKKERVKKLEQLASASALKFVESMMTGKDHQVLIEASEKAGSYGYTSSYIKINTLKSLPRNEFKFLHAGSASIVDGVVEIQE